MYIYTRYQNRMFPFLKLTVLVLLVLFLDASDSSPSSAKSDSPYVPDWAIEILCASTISISALPKDPFAASRRDRRLRYRERCHLASRGRRCRPATPLWRCFLRLGNPVCRCCLSRIQIYSIAIGSCPPVGESTPRAG